MPSLAERAWDAVKTKDEPNFADIPNQTFRDDLQTRADGVVRTGLAINPFEEKVKELQAEDKESQDKKPLTENKSLDEAKSAAVGDGSAAPDAPPAPPVVAVKASPSDTGNGKKK